MASELMQNTDFVSTLLHAVFWLKSISGTAYMCMEIVSNEFDPFEM